MSLFAALYDFDSQINGQLTFKCGERFILLDKACGDWWNVKRLNDEKEGFIPSNYVEAVPSHESQEWYFGDISRSSAENLLRKPQNSKGSFLIRNQQSKGHKFTLSVRKNDDAVQHYRIFQEGKKESYVLLKKSFDTLVDLVECLSTIDDPAYPKLCRPCFPDSGNADHARPADSKDHWEIDRSEVILTKPLGEGHFGIVYEGVLNGKQVAVKTFKVGNSAEEEFLAEAKLMKDLTHPNLLKLIAICTSGRPIYIVLEFMENGCLLDYMKKRKEKRKPLSTCEMCSFAAQIASGMEYLEARNYVHCDLAARNILVDQNESVKIADFGYTRLVSDEQKHVILSSDIPIKWTAPEAVKNKTFSTKSDVWSYGVLLWEIVTCGDFPYAKMNNKQVVSQLIRGYRMPKPLRCPDELYRIMLDCWNIVPESRPDFRMLKMDLDTLCAYDFNC